VPLALGLRQQIAYHVRVFYFLTRGHLLVWLLVQTDFIKILWTIFVQLVIPLALLAQAGAAHNVYLAQFLCIFNLRLLLVWILAIWINTNNQHPPQSALAATPHALHVLVLLLQNVFLAVEAYFWTPLQASVSLLAQLGNIRIQLRIFAQTATLIV